MTEAANKNKHHSTCTYVIVWISGLLVVSLSNLHDNDSTTINYQKSLFGVHAQVSYIYIFITCYILHITYYILPIDCLSIALDAHMLSHNGYGPGTRAQGPKRARPGTRPGPAPFLGPGVESRAHIHHG